MTNQNIRCWQEAPLGYLGPLSALATPVNSWETLKGGSRASIAPSLAKQFDTISGRVRRSNAAKKVLWLYSYSLSCNMAIYL